MINACISVRRILTSDRTLFPFITAFHIPMGLGIIEKFKFCVQLSPA
jgi:hypothetical protein